MVRKRVPPAQKITKNGKINGAPVTWTDELIEAEANALSEWMNTGCPHKLLDFCNSREILLDDLYYFADISPRFSRTLKLARQKVAANREDMVNREEMNYGVFNRYVTFYDHMLNLHERAEKVHDAELKRQIVAGASGNVTVNITDYGK